MALQKEVFDKFRELASRRFGTSASKLGVVVLDEYLKHAEKFYFGKERARATMNVESSSRTVDAVIFDMDGVLCSSEIASRQAGLVTLNELYQISDACTSDFEAFTGMGEGRFLAGVAELYGVGPDKFDEKAAKELFFDVYLNGGFVRNVSVFPGVKNLVTRLKGTGLKVGVASAADLVKVTANLAVSGLDDDGLFDHITSSDDITRKKPAPDVFLAAAAGLQVDPSRCVVIEDAVAGVQAAKAAGMRCIGVATSLAPDLLESAGADVVRNEPALIALEDIFGEPLLIDHAMQTPDDEAANITATNAENTS